jgi:hypothetical protein
MSTFDAGRALINLARKDCLDNRKHMPHITTNYSCDNEISTLKFNCKDLYFGVRGWGFGPDWIRHPRARNFVRKYYH